MYTLVLGFPFWCSSKLGAEAVGYPHVGLTVLCAAHLDHFYQKPEKSTASSPTGP